MVLSAAGRGLSLRGRRGHHASTLTAPCAINRPRGSPFPGPSEGQKNLPLKLDDGNRAAGRYVSIERPQKESTGARRPRHYGLAHGRYPSGSSRSRPSDDAPQTFLPRRAEIDGK